MRELYSKFPKRNRAPRILHKRCEGPSIEKLKQVCLDASSSVDDFDLALKELDRHSLIKTSTPGAASATRVGIVSFAPVMDSIEYAYLGEERDKEVRRPEHLPTSLEAAVEPLFQDSAPQHEESAEYVSLLAEAVEVAVTEMEADLALAGSDGAGSRRVNALRNAQFEMNKLQDHMSSSRRILDDLRTLRRLLVEEWALTDRFRQVAG